MHSKLNSSVALAMFQGLSRHVQAVASALDSAAVGRLPPCRKFSWTAGLWKGCSAAPAPFPSHCALFHSLPPSSPGHAGDDRRTLPCFFERRTLSSACQRRPRAAQVSWAGRTYLCRPPPRRGGRWLPTPAKRLAARSLKCPASPWRPAAG